MLFLAFNCRATWSEFDTHWQKTLSSQRPCVFTTDSTCTLLFRICTCRTSGWGLMSGSAGLDHPPAADLVALRPTPGLGALALEAASWAVRPAAALPDLVAEAALPDLVAEAEGVVAAADAGAGAGGRTAAAAARVADLEAGSARAAGGGLGEGASCLRLVMKRSVLDLHRATMFWERWGQGKE
jgi:hypothetical protein